METEKNDKVRENRLRRAAERQGLRLVKSRRKDPRSIEYGTYMLVDADTGIVAWSGNHENGFGLDLDDVEEYLNRPVA